jgi:hypothetical protein
MKHYSEAAVERMMKVQEVILRALAGKLHWWQAAQILGVSGRTMRRWRWRYQQHGRQGVDKPDFTVEKILNLVQMDPILSAMNGRRELFEFLSPVSDDQLRQLLNDLFP